MRDEIRLTQQRVLGSGFGFRRAALFLLNTQGHLHNVFQFSAVFLQALAGVSYPLTVAAAAAPTGACGKSRATPGHIATGAVLMMGVACWCKRRPRPYRQQGRSTISSKCRHRRSSRGYIAERSPRCCRRGHWWGWSGQETGLAADVGVRPSPPAAAAAYRRYRNCCEIVLLATSLAKDAALALHRARWSSAPIAM